MDLFWSRALRRTWNTTSRRGARGLPRSRLFSQTRFLAQPAGDAIHTTKSPIWRRLRGTAIAVTFTGVGFLLGTSSTLQILWEAQHALSDAQTLDPALMQDDDEIREIDEHIRQHPLAVALRNDPTLTESRPHLKIPATMLKHHLTGGLLMGPGRVTVPPLVFTEAGGKSLVAISHLGADLCGHPGIVHGGLLATLIDEGLARCCFGALPNHIAMTANLKIDYRAPVKAGTYVVLRAKTVKVEGRKAWVTGHVETLVDEGQTPVLLAEATGLFIEPRNAAIMKRAFPIS